MPGREGTSLKQVNEKPDRSETNVFWRFAVEQQVLLRDSTNAAPHA
jgi:hypothetical protein